MIKFFAFINLAGLLLLNWFFAAGVSITQEMPAQIRPGTEARVTVTVNKEDIKGFAKLQIELPKGLSATAIETNGASFTFADGKAKFIWMALPTTPSFTVSYTLSAAADAEGDFTITGQLSYIADNQRIAVDIVPASVHVGGAMAQAPKTPRVTPPDETREPASQAVAGQTKLTTGETNWGTTTGIGEGNVKVTRTITQAGPTEFLVELRIDKGILRGFGKVQETIPDGFAAVEKNNDGAIFSMSGQTVKFIWLNMPAKDQLVLSYRLWASDAKEGAYTVDGEFGYLLNDLTQRVAIGPSTFNMDGQMVAQETPEQPDEEEPAQTAQTTPTAPTAPTTETTRTAPPQPEQPAHVEPETTASNHQAEPPVKQTPPRATSTPAPETGINFKVQITAAHREVGAEYFAQRHRYHGDFSIEHHEGWIKYVTGNFAQYREARDQREAYINAQYNFPGPFVTAYNNGDRITVQEALMVAKQNWVQ